MRTLVRILVVAALLVPFGPIGAAPAGAGGGGCHRDAMTGPVEGTGAEVELVDVCMSPSVLRVDPGTMVTFTNRDAALHNLFGSGISVSELASGRSASFRFDDAGTFAYACTYHPGMVGAIAVGDGRRVAPLTRSIAPVEVQAALAAVPTAVSTPVTAEDEPPFPVVPAAAAAAAVALVGYLAGRRKRLG